MKLISASMRRLKLVHPDLVKVILLAADTFPGAFIVTEGLRSKERQQELVKAGKSLTLNSRHLADAHGFSRAVDLAIWLDKDLDRVVDTDELSWRLPYYKELADYVLKAAEQLNIPVVWGGSWSKLVDGPHFELDRKVYP